MSHSGRLSDDDRDAIAGRHAERAKPERQVADALEQLLARQPVDCHSGVIARGPQSPGPFLGTCSPRQRPIASGLGNRPIAWNGRSAIVFRSASGAVSGSTAGGITAAA